MSAFEREWEETPDSDAPTDPERLGPYRLIEEIGEGGMGVVHLAVDRKGRAVAIKALRPHVANDTEARTRLVREVETLGLVKDDRVASVIDADVMGPRPYIVTRWVPGPSLDEIVEEEGPFPPHELLRLARGMAEAIRAIHACGVVHRDIKPGNVLLEDGEPVLIDFGIAHLQDDVRHTVGGLVMGTPGYLSPELVEGAPITEATDWWGWAATITYAASGRPPFGRGRMDAVLARVRAGEVDLDGVDERLVPLLRSALSVRPTERPHAADVVTALERYALGYAATVPTPVGPGWDADGRPGSTQVLDRGGTSVLPPVSPPAPASAPPPTGAPVSAQPPAPAPPTPAAPARAVARSGVGGGAPRSGPVRSGLPSGPVGGRPVSAPVPAHPPGGDAYWDDGAAEPPARTKTEARGGSALRTSVLLGLAVAWLGVLAAWPGIGLVTLVGWSSVARAADRTVTQLVLRRHDRGRRTSDVPWMVALGPWHLLLGAIATAVGLLLPAALAIAGIYSSALLLAGLTGSDVSPGEPMTLVCGGALALVMVWWGAGGASLRRGSRALVRKVVPAGVAAQVTGWVLAGLGVVLVLTATSNGESLGWWPFSGNPFG